MGLGILFFIIRSKRERRVKLGIWPTQVQGRRQIVSPPCGLGRGRKGERDGGQICGTFFAEKKGKRMPARAFAVYYEKDEKGGGKGKRREGRLQGVLYGEKKKGAQGVAKGRGGEGCV